mmetsp:Transcript_36170/g.116466  ORF Transcript_36170/g.116466 Transcript_36170/m.116466 type:complete len:328 (-) Transcript_36170:466-1449(-)
MAPSEPDGAYSATMRICCPCAVVASSTTEPGWHDALSLAARAGSVSPSSSAERGGRERSSATVSTLHGARCLRMCGSKCGSPSWHTRYAHPVPFASCASKSRTPVLTMRRAPRVSARSSDSTSPDTSSSERPVGERATRRCAGKGAASAAGDGGGGGGGPRLKLINVYVPNSGADLQRLEYRTDRAAGWDARFRAAIAAQATGESRVCVCGDMNVAHEDVDFHNPAERRTLTQAGTTPEERASLRCFLEPPLRMRDAFRQVHGRAAGQYTYWSQRARARPANRGLRIDYFLLASGVPPAAVVDVQHLQEMHGSDHCPILLELDLARL